MGDIALADMMRFRGEGFIGIAADQKFAFGFYMHTIILY